MMIPKTSPSRIFLVVLMLVGGFAIAPKSLQAQAPAPATVAPPASTPLPAQTQTPVKPAEAQTAEAEKKEETVSRFKPVPSYDLPQEEFEAKTRVFEQTPLRNEGMAYSLRIPKNWEQVKANDGTEADAAATTTNILSEVARFYGPSFLDSRTYFKINFSSLQQAITAENWFLNYAQQNSYPLQFMTVISEKKVEAFYVMVEGDTSYVVRSIAEINGNMVALLTYAAPEQKWRDESAMQDHVLRSFAFKEKVERQVEERRTYAFLDLLRFDYPASWRLLAPNIYSIEAMDAKIINSIDEKTVNGEIDVHVVSTELDTTLAEEVKTLQTAFEERGLFIGKMIEQPSKFKMNENIYFSRIEVYEANNKDKTLIDHEYWIGILIEDRYFYIVTMLTPARTSNFYVWATNAEAFETVVESLRP